MSIFRRKRKHPSNKGISRFKAGLIAILLIAVGTYFGFTKANPFANPYKLSAVFETVNNLKIGSPVRIAGVEVGKVKKVTAITPGKGNGAARVEMHIKKSGLPIHEDATLKVRPRVFLEGNFFVDLKPGSPSARVLETEDDPIPVTQTAAPVQFGDLLAALQTDTRADLQVFLKEYSQGLAGKGAAGFNQSFKNGKEAFKSTAIASEATLGQDPTKDLQRVLKGQQETFAALVRDEESLKDLVTNLRVTAGKFASEDLALEASLPALQRTLRVGSPALASLNSALPSLRAFAMDALPGVRSSAPTLRASLPFISQVRALVSPNELQGAARALRRQIPQLAGLNRDLLPFLRQARLLSSCTNEVLVPWANTPIPNPDEPDNDEQTFVRQASRGFVGLAGESRNTDGNQSYFNTSAVPAAPSVRPAPPLDGGSQPPPRRPDVPCETQEPPNMNAPGASVSQLGGGGSSAPQSFNSASLLRAGRLIEKYENGEGAKRKQRVVEFYEDAAAAIEAKGAAK
ncbi:MAG: MlaD family protein [Thermoleophilaceae bacterium]